MAGLAALQEAPAGEEGGEGGGGSTLRILVSSVFLPFRIYFLCLAFFFPATPPRRPPRLRGRGSPTMTTRHREASRESVGLGR